MKKNLSLLVLFCIAAVIHISMFDETSASSAPVTIVRTSAELSQAALNCVDGEHIVLGSDIRAGKSLLFSVDNKEVFLDLAGHRLTVTDEQKYALGMSGKGKLIINDSQDTGRLHTECTYVKGENVDDSSGIRVTAGQTLIINGADVFAKAGKFGAGIGAYMSPVGVIIIKEGYVTAEGGMYGAGIGGGRNRFSGNIVIEGGRVHGTGGSFGAGIGTGGFNIVEECVTGNQITIRNGNIKAVGGVNAAGIGGGHHQTNPEIIILDGKTEAYGGASGAGIGSGHLSIASDIEDIYAGQEYSSGAITIKSGNIMAVGGKAAAGIGTGEGSSDFTTEFMCKDRIVKIEGGNIYAKGGRSGAGIGGGAFLSGGIVDIKPIDGSKMVIDALGGINGAGIGGGKGGSAGVMLSVNGGTVTATGGANAAGIGTGGFTREHIQPTGSYFTECKNVSITSGLVKAIGGNDAAAIGGGTGGAGVNLTISGTPIVEAVSKYEITVGAGKYSIDHGSCIISGGNINVNRQIGAQPSGSPKRPVYPAVLTVVTKDDKAPVTGATIEAITDDSYMYHAITDSNGMAAMYLPADSVDLSVRTADGSLRNRKLGKINVTTDSKESSVLEVENDEPIKILSHAYTLYPGDDNTFQLEYTGGVNDTTSFSVNSNESNISIDKNTGILTIPIQIQPGEHNIIINALKGTEITDSVNFTINVVDELSSIDIGPRDILAEINKDILIHLTPQPLTAEIVYSNWKVLHGSDGEYMLKELIDEGGDRAVCFTSFKPGIITLMAAAQDARGNKAWGTINVNVVDPLTTVFSDISNEDGKAEDEKDKLTAWSVDRIGPDIAKLEFEFSGDGEYEYKLMKNDSLIKQDKVRLRNGYNRLVLSELLTDEAYECRINIINDQNNEVLVGTIAIPAFIVEDILPPSLTDIQVNRESGSTATVFFSSDEPGLYSHYFYKMVGTETKISPFTPLLKGRNKIKLDNLESWSSYTLKLLVEDDVGNWGNMSTITIPAYQRTDAIQPILTSGWSIRKGAKSAKIGFNANMEGEYCYSYSKDGVLSEQTYSEQFLAVEGFNEIMVNNLPDNEACDLLISMKNKSSGKESNVLKINIGMYDANNNTTCVLKTMDVQTLSGGIALVSFMSDMPGEYFYYLAEDSECLQDIAATSVSHEMAAGENIISLTHLTAGKNYTLYVAGKTEDGEVGEMIQTDIKIEEENRQEIVFL